MLHVVDFLTWLRKVGLLLTGSSRELFHSQEDNVEVEWETSVETPDTCIGICSLQLPSFVLLSPPLIWCSNPRSTWRRASLAFSYATIAWPQIQTWSWSIDHDLPISIPIMQKMIFSIFSVISSRYYSNWPKMIGNFSVICTQTAKKECKFC